MNKNMTKTEIKKVFLFFLYAMILLDAWTWVICPAPVFQLLFFNVLWKWEIFVALVFAPLIIWNF